ncbi:hypothetical protein BDW74DRAFT_172120 [Aspergillus multicolor]|uniref:uncharacterized protein n=1 Tax=Aspergillus multicolor TaxID=41759 RepID=UPI003CCD62D2
MGTRGLVIYRCNGRYYVYYNHWDSYPEGLGEALVRQIPADPRNIKVTWLEKMRQTYSRLGQEFEDEILCVSPKFGQPWSMSSPVERFAQSYKAVDDMLQAPPTHALLDAGDDLDRELLTVDKAVSFNLSQLPHHPGWHSYLTEDRRKRKALAKNTPSNLIGMRERYKTFNVEVDLAVALGSFDSVNPSRRRLLLKAVLFICRAYRTLIDRSYAEWTSTSSPFREIAFAILSVAAGDVAFACPEHLNDTYSSEGFFLIPDKGHRPGTDSGSAPQSNPFWLGNVLVYLTPRTDLVEVQEAAVATVVESGLQQGLKSFDALLFSILDVIFIRVEKSQDGEAKVTKSPLMNFIYFDESNSAYPNGPRSKITKLPSEEESTEGNQLKEAEKQKNEQDDAEGAIAAADGAADEGGIDKAADTQKARGTGDADDGGDNDNTDDDDTNDGANEGDDHGHGHDKDDEDVTGQEIALFTGIMLTQFFDSVMDRKVAGTKSRVFPNEILTRIMEFSGHQTYLSLAQASDCCRDFYCRKSRLNDDYALVPDSEGTPSDSWTLEELDSGRKLVTSAGSNKQNKNALWSIPKKTNELTLSPIIGIGKRSSVIDGVSLEYPGIPLKRPPYSGPEDIINESAEELDRYWPGRRDPERLFALPDHLYLEYLEAAFER